MKSWFLPFSILVVFSSPLADARPQYSYSSNKLGAVSFPTSCATNIQEMIERGVALLHSFLFDEADRQFKNAIGQDPQCAIAYWGDAMSLFRLMWSIPEEVDLKRGSDLIQEAHAIGARTQREREYIDALAVLYRDYDKVDNATRVARYSQAMEKLYNHYSTDHEAATFYALSLLASEPTNDTSLSNRTKAIEILTPLFAAEPNHPGAAHYLIHAADHPKLAQAGLKAALSYAQIAPASPHALHMPSHIFARLGFWQQDIQSNLATIAATDQPSPMHIGAEHRVHAMDFLEYAYLQIGEDNKAKAMVDALGNIRQEDMDSGLDGYVDQMRAHFPAMYALERRQWKEAMELQPPPGAEPENQQITYWARAVGAGHMHDVAAAEEAVNQFDAALDQVRKGKHPGRAGSMSTNRDEAHAWLSFAKGKNDQSLELIRSVSDEQDAEGKGEVELPAREMLADMLLEVGRSHEALLEYEKSMNIDPNRFNGLYGAGRAAELSLRTESATRYYAKLLKNCDNASLSDRAELARARKLLTQAGHN